MVMEWAKENGVELENLTEEAEEQIRKKRRQQTVIHSREPEKVRQRC
jgi:hypothetical protein